MLVLLMRTLLPLIPANPVRLRGWWGVITVASWKKRLILAVRVVWVRVMAVTMGRRRIITVTLWLWTAGVTETLRFRLRVVIGNSWKSFLLDIAVSLTKGSFSFVEGAQLREVTGWTSQNKIINDVCSKKYLNRKSFPKQDESRWKIKRVGMKVLIQVSWHAHLLPFHIRAIGNLIGRKLVDGHAETRWREWKVFMTQSDLQGASACFISKAADCI